MPAGAEAIRAERSARGSQAPVSEPAPAFPHSDQSPIRDHVHGNDHGRTIIRSAWMGTGVFVVATGAAAVFTQAGIVAALVDLVLFFGGAGLYLWGWGVAARRSREAEISLWSLILLEGAAPRGVRSRLLAAVGVQVAVAVGTCWITAALAFGWLVPMWGLAHCQLWGARYGRFNPRRPPATEARVNGSSR